MPNHFHFLTRIKEKEELEEVIKSFKASTGFEPLSKLDDSIVSKIVNQQFSNLFNSYTQAFNKVYKRKGGLFMRPYKRIRVNDIAYLTKLVHYIHNNPVEGGYCVYPNQ
jgi:REP element-mobilizing transposase RayT